jgi:hypothetical protein
MAPREQTVFAPIHRARPICLECGRRPALARIRGQWRVVKHHDVCRQCWRTLMDSRAATRLALQLAAARRARDPRRNRSLARPPHPTAVPHHR